ncbi:MAG TPA: phosphoribosylanthranilate isomerase [Clostridia bacterium]|nr:phosphoribosylanthranilate isomerase [Clostridia bacterium]
MTKIKICGITNIVEVNFLNRYLPDYIGFVFTESKRRVTPEKAVDLAAGLSPAIRKVGVFVDMEPGEAAGIAAFVGLDVLQLHGSENAEYIGLLRRLLKPGTEIWKAVRMGAGRGAGMGVRMGAGMDGENGNNGCNGSNGSNRKNSRLHADTDVLSGSGTDDVAGAYGTHSAADAEQAYKSFESYGADRLILDTYIANSSGGTGRTFDWGLAEKLKKLTPLPIVLAGGLHPGNVRQAIERISPFAVDTSSGVEGDGIKDEEKVRNFIEAVRRESR